MNKNELDSKDPIKDPILDLLEKLHQELKRHEHITLGTGTSGPRVDQEWLSIYVGVGHMYVEKDFKCYYLTMTGGAQVVEEGGVVK